MYTKLVAFSLSFTAITSYAMLPGRVLSLQLVRTIISHTTKPTQNPSPQLPIFEQAAEIQTALRRAKQIVQSEISLCTKASQEQELTIAVFENRQKQISSGAWFLGLPEKKAPSNRHIVAKPTKKTGKRA